MYRFLARARNDKMGVPLPKQDLKNLFNPAYYFDVDFIAGQIDPLFVMPSGRKIIFRDKNLLETQFLRFGNALFNPVNRTDLAG